MRATARSCVYFLVALVVVALGCLAAKPAEQPFDRLAKLASYISEGNASSAAGMFDPQMKGYGDLQNNLAAIAAQADALCSIDLVSDLESGGVRKLDVDWFLQLTGKAEQAPLERRRERVQLEMRQLKGKWVITAMSPLSILAPIRLGR